MYTRSCIHILCLICINRFWYEPCVSMARCASDCLQDVGQVDTIRLVSGRVTWKAHPWVCIVFKSIKIRVYIIYIYICLNACVHPALIFHPRRHWRVMCWWRHCQHTFRWSNHSLPPKAKKIVGEDQHRKKPLGTGWAGAQNPAQPGLKHPRYVWTLVCIQLWFSILADTEELCVGGATVSTPSADRTIHFHQKLKR